MKRPGVSLSLACFIWLLAFAETAQAVSLRVGVVRGFPGNTVEVPVSLNYRSNELRNVVGLQADVLFDASGINDANPTSGPLLDHHDLASSAPWSGVRRLLVYSPESAVLTNGTIAHIPFTVAPNAFRNFSLASLVECDFGAGRCNAGAGNERERVRGREPGVRGAGWTCGWFSDRGVEWSRAVLCHPGYDEFSNVGKRAYQ
jgi:hypothetical protein